MRLSGDLWYIGGDPSRDRTGHGTMVLNPWSVTEGCTVEERVTVGDVPRRVLSPSCLDLRPGTPTTSGPSSFPKLYLLGSGLVTPSLSPGPLPRRDSHLCLEPEHCGTSGAETGASGTV